MRTPEKSNAAKTRILGVVLCSVFLFAVGANTMFGEDPRDTVREEVERVLLRLAARAQAYHHRPYSEGGGGGSFVGLTADAAGLYKLTSRGKFGNAMGVYSITTAGTTYMVELQGIGIVPGNNGFPINIRVAVFPDSVFVTLNN